MSVVKILSKSVNYLERSIIYEVDGEKKLISAPLGIKTFEEMEAELRAKYGDDGAHQMANVSKEETPSEKVEPKPTPTKKNIKSVGAKGGASK